MGTWQWSRKWSLTPSTKRVSHRGSLLKGVAVHQESPCSDIFRKRATSHFWNRNILRKNTAIYQDILEHFMLSYADKLYGEADFIFQQDLAPAHTAKDTKSWFNDHGVTVLDWWANSPDLNPIENLWCIVKRKIRDTRLDNADDLKAAIKATWASIIPEQCHSLIASIALMQYFMQKEAQPSICGWSLWMEIIETNDVLLRIKRFLLKNRPQPKQYWKFHTSVLLADHVKQCRSLCSSLPRPLAPPAGVISYHPNLI